tara:strand:+ start:1084 stop:1203 length:120 start_codon:yes stop_codon:yes gene_type:complete
MSDNTKKAKRNHLKNKTLKLKGGSKKYIQKIIMKVEMVC